MKFLFMYVQKICTLRYYDLPSERSELSSYQQSYMGRPVDIQSPFIKIGKI